MGDLINWYEVLVGIPQEMRLLERRKRRWDDNIEIVNKELRSSRDKCAPVCGPAVGFCGCGNEIRSFSETVKFWSS